MNNAVVSFFLILNLQYSSSEVNEVKNPSAEKFSEKYVKLAKESQLAKILYKTILIKMILTIKILNGFRMALQKIYKAKL